jgi:hypothetical protein
MVDTNAKVLISVSTLSLKVNSGESVPCRKLGVFYVRLTVHANRNIVYFYYQLDAQILYFNTFITFLYMFRALLCSSSGGQIVSMKHLVRHSGNK